MDKKMKELALSLQRSKLTLRRLDIHFDILFDPHPEELPESLMEFFKAFPNVERLNLTPDDLPEVEEQLPGVLSMIAFNWFSCSKDWSPKDLERISSLTRLHLDEESHFESPGCLYQVLQACRHSLRHLALGPVVWQDQVTLDMEFPVLSTLRLGMVGQLEDLFTLPMPSLELLEGTAEVLGDLNITGLQEFNIIVESHDWGEEDYRLPGLESMIKLLRDSSSTLRSIKLKTGKQGRFGIDPFLRTLKVDYLSPLCPLLSDLYISKEQDFGINLLAEVMVSRNFAGKGWKFEGAVGDEDDEGEGEGELETSCSKLVLHLDASHIKQFKSAEKEVLSRIPRWMSRRAGRTSVREWDGK